MAKSQLQIIQEKRGAQSRARFKRAQRMKRSGFHRLKAPTVPVHPNFKIRRMPEGYKPPVAGKKKEGFLTRMRRALNMS